MRVVCPGCQHPTDLTRADARAESFCPNCDYPLFWAVEEDHAAVERSRGGGADDDLRRRPGSAGRRIPGEPCRACGEINPRRAVYCGRCGVELRPATAAPPAPEPPPAPVPAPMTEDELPAVPRWPILPIAIALAGIVVLGGLLFGLEVFASLLVLSVAGGALVAVLATEPWLR